MIRRLRIKELETIVGFKRPTIYNKIKRGEFPPPKKDGRTSYWLSDEVEKWVIEDNNGT